MELKAIIEIPANTFAKYEFNKETNTLELDRILPIPCPYNYGFIPSSPLSEDGDPLDIFIIAPVPINALVEVKFRVWGILLCEDNGVEDNKVIAGVDGNDYIDYDYFKKIRFYLENYKQGFKVKEYKVFNDELLFRNFVETKK